MTQPETTGAGWKEFSASLEQHGFLKHCIPPQVFWFCSVEDQVIDLAQYIS